MTKADREAAVYDNKNMADRALRVLCAAYRIYDEMPQDTEPQALEKDLTYIGLVGMIDPVRDEVIPAIQQCRNAGIRPVMITGDHKDTAVAIGKQIGIIKDESEAVTGAQLDEMSDEQLWETTMNPEKRRLRQITIENAAQAERTFSMLMGDDVPPRRQFIEENATYANIDA